MVYGFAFQCMHISEFAYFNGVSFSHQVANNTDRLTLDACFTPTSQFVITTAPDGFLQVWSVETGGRVAALPSFEAASQMSGPSGILNCVAFNPRFAMLATGSQQTSFWLPNIDPE